MVRVVDDDVVFLRAVRVLLHAAGFHVETFETPEAFLARRGTAPGCVVLDLHMPGAGGLDIQREIAQDDTPLPVIFLTGRGDVRSSVHAMRHGAVDFLTKPAATEELVDAVRRAITLDEAARVERERMRALRARYETLTARERQVFALVARGLLNKQIAAELGRSERTVKAHRANIMRKMKLDSVVELARAADRLRDPSSPGSVGN